MEHQYKFDSKRLILLCIAIFCSACLIFFLGATYGRGLSKIGPGIGSGPVDPAKAGVAVPATPGVPGSSVASGALGAVGAANAAQANAYAKVGAANSVLQVIPGAKPIPQVPAMPVAPPAVYLASQIATSAAANSAASKPAAAPAASPAAAPAPAPNAAPQAPGAAAPDPQSPAAASPPPAAGAVAAAPNPADEPYVLQLGAFRDQKAAKLLQAELKQKGINSVIYNMVDEEQRTWHMVRTGAFKDMSSAARAAADLTTKEGVQALVRRSDSL